MTMTVKSHPVRRALSALLLILPVTFVILGGVSGIAVADAIEPTVSGVDVSSAAVSYRFGSEPYADTLAAAQEQARCGLSQLQLAALMVAPSYPETGASWPSAPSPMTLSRWDNQDALYSFSSRATSFPRAFWHPGVGVWAFDSAGGWDLTGAEAMDTATASRVVASEMAKRWCAFAGDPANEPARREFVWGPWHGCAADRCEEIYNAIYDPAGLHLSLDPGVTRTGGVQLRSCNVPGVGVLRCHYVDPALAQGAKGFASPTFGPSPVTSPFYVIRIGNTEQRWWLKEDSGYTQTVSASKLVKANARTMVPTPAIQWRSGDGLCDLTVQKGACGSPQVGATRFNEMTPVRVLDSRPESRVGPYSTPWGSGETRSLQVAGVAGVPAFAPVVALNVTAVTPSEATHVTVWPTGQAKPATSSLNVPRGDIRANLVTVETGSNGMVSLYNNYGATNLVIDVVGWYDPSTGNRYNAVQPERLLDTRTGPGQVGRVGRAQSVSVKVTSVAGVPVGATGVMLNVTAVNPTAATHVTVWPAGSARPLASNLNLPAGDTRANLVPMKVGQGGQVSLYNNAGSVDLIVDIVGWYGPAGAGMSPVTPSRIWDSRTGPGGPGRLSGPSIRGLTVAGNGGVPSYASMVVLNVAAVNPTASTYLTIWSAGSDKPATSNVNIPVGDTRANLVVVPVGVGGTIVVYNNVGSVDVVVDVVGWLR